MSDPIIYNTEVLLQSAVYTEVKVVLLVVFDKTPEGLFVHGVIAGETTEFMGAFMPSAPPIEAGNIDEAEIIAEIVTSAIKHDQRMYPEKYADQLQMLEKLEAGELIDRGFNTDQLEDSLFIDNTNFTLN